MPSPFRLACLQTLSPAGDSALAWRQIEAALQDAAAAGAMMLTLPETFLPGYNLADMAAQGLPAGDGYWQDRLAQACRRSGCGIVLGYAERDQGQLYNAAIALDATGKQLAHYRKIQLYGAREAALYTAGDRYAIFDLAGQKAALLICYDVEFAPHVAALASRGVTLLLVPTANMLPFTHVMRATVPAMAANHGVAIVYANYCGRERDLTYAGGSLICGPHGEVLAQADDGPALLTADLPPRDPARLSTQARDYRAVR